MARKRDYSVAAKVARAFVVVSWVILAIAWERAYLARQEPPAWAQILFIPFFIAGLFLVDADLARESGWEALAARYRARSRPKGPSLAHQVTRIGKVSEGGITRLIIADEGLVLVPVIFFRFRRPALLIPWREIGWVRVFKELWFTVYELDLGGITSIRIRKKAYERIKNLVPAPGIGPPSPLPGTPPPPIE